MNPVIHWVPLFLLAILIKSMLRLTYLSYAEFVIRKNILSAINPVLIAANSEVGIDISNI